VVQMSDVGFNPKQHWQSEGLNYQYWTKTDVNGNFTIKNIRLGNNYRFYTFQKGVVEEFTAGPFNLIANDPQVVNLSAKITAPNNTFNCEVDRSKGGLVLEVGYPDRDTKEFAFGDKYFTAEIWDKWFQPLFPTNKPAVYNYSPASPKNYKQWPYVHSGWFDPVSRGWSKWDREINFPINGTPTTGATARMTFALAGSDDRQNGDGSWRKNIVVNVNGYTNVATITPGYDDGSFRRAGGHGAYKVMYADIPTRFLRGENANNNISLSYTYVSQFYSVVYYDYLSLEVPGIRGVITDLKQDSEFNHVYTLSPNPSNTGFINLSVGQESDGMIELKILDIEGKTVHNEILQNASGNTQNIDISSLNPGLYFFNVKDSKGSKTMKFINE
jgi:rhamnogalacturonan endolyase